MPYLWMEWNQYNIYVVVQLCTLDTRRVANGINIDTDAMKREHKKPSYAFECYYNMLCSVLDNGHITENQHSVTVYITGGGCHLTSIMP